MRKKDPKTKNCEQCSGLMIQPRWANGKLDSTFKSRRFCSIECSRLSRLAMPSQEKAAGRKRAQRMYKLKPCVKCGTDQSQRHHKDGNPSNNSVNNIEFLCASCHAAEHIADGSWGKKKVLAPRNCPICGVSFQPRKGRDKLCKEKSCSVEMGKRSAALRWG